MADGVASIPTAPRSHDHRRQQRGLWIRRAFMAGLMVVLALAALGVFGERGRTTHGEGDGWILDVHYPQTTRGGLSSVYEVELRRTDGAPLPDTVSLAIDNDYLRLFDDHAIEPTPEAIHADGDTTVWTLAPRRGADHLTVLLDGRIDPSTGPGWHHGTTTLLIDGEPAVTVGHRTWVWP